MSAQAGLRWVGAAPHVVFEDAHLRVMFQPGGSDMLLLTFGDAAVLADGMRFFADTVAAKFGINCLGFMARAANWYPAASMQAAARAVAYTLAAFDIRMGYGSSMGAYAAVKYSALLGATHVLALCPQWSIDPAECGGNESGYRDFFRPAMAGMGVTEADMAGEITVFYDPGQRDDAYHYRTLAACSPRVRACRVHHAGHHLAPVLRGSRLAVDLMQACYLGDPARLYALVNRPRRASVHRRRNLLAASAGRHPRLTLAALRQVVRDGQGQYMDGARCFVPLHRALRASGTPALADELLALLRPIVGSARAALIDEGTDAAVYPDCLLRSAHGGVLCYSALGGCLTHAAWPQGRLGIPGLRPVEVRHGKLAVTIGDDVYMCRSDDVHRTELVLLSTHEPKCFEAWAAQGNAWCFVSGGRFASAKPDGTIWRAATQPEAWEVFTDEQAGLSSGLARQV